MIDELFTENIDIEMEALIIGNLRDTSRNNKNRISRQWFQRIGCTLNSLIIAVNQLERQLNDKKTIT